MSAEIYRCATCNSPLLADFKFCPTCGSPNAYYRPREAAPSTPAPPATIGPAIEQAADSRDASAILDFAALFGYGNAAEAPGHLAQETGQVSGTGSQPTSEDSGQLQANSIGETGSQIASPLEEAGAPEMILQVAEGGMQAPEESTPEIRGASEAVQVGIGKDTGPLQVSEPGTMASGELPEEQAPESGPSRDGENDSAVETPIYLQGNSQEPEQVYKGGASTGPLHEEEAPVVVMAVAEAADDAIGDTAEVDRQAEPAATVTGHDEGAEAQVEQSSLSQADQAAQATQETQSDQTAQATQTGPLSFSDLFSWTTDESQPGSYAPLTSTPSLQEQDATPTQPSWQETNRASTQISQEQASEPTPVIVTYDSSSTHQDEATQYNVPSWKPGDEDQSASQQQVWTPPPTPTTPIYQSYSPSVPPIQPQTTPTSPDQPPPGQRPKPGTPEYEEMARRALETRGIQATPPQGYPSQGSQAGQVSYSQPAPPPIPPVTPSVPPPGQRPKPGTPEYEEMARRALEERLKQQGGATAAQPTPAYGYTTQSSEGNYAPSPPPIPPVTPSVPPPGQRPKPGTPEYEEMARRAMEERLKQQGK